MNPDEHDHGYCDPLTHRVLSAVFEVSNTLGAGFLEKVYERALLLELTLRGIRSAAQNSTRFCAATWSASCRILNAATAHSAGAQ
ncbi:MAG TPA: GxxExxY protein [Terracidiphilus sp.]|nr:GxxExxY protein [Terracidiphilus sp.]